MTFGEALKKMEAGAFVAREGWNGQNQFIFLVEGSIPDVQELRGRAKAAANYARRTMGGQFLDGPTGREVVVIHPHIDMFTEQHTIVCGWLASQTDMTADDWYVRDYAQNHQEKQTCGTCKWNKPVEVKGGQLDNCTARNRMHDPSTCWEAKDGTQSN